VTNDANESYLLERRTRRQRAHALPESVKGLGPITGLAIGGLVELIAISESRVRASKPAPRRLPAKVGSSSTKKPAKEDPSSFQRK